MSQKKANQINNGFRALVIGLSIALGIAALIKNPAHLVTAGIIFSVGVNANIVKADEFDLRK